MIFARLRGLTYAHSPLTDIEHAPPGTSRAEWSAAWESFFSLGSGEVSAADLEADGIRTIALPKPHRGRLQSDSLHVVAHCHKVTDRHPDAWAAIAPTLREKYLSTPKPVLPTDPPAAIRIAVHLRRGDVDPSGRFAERFTADDKVLGRLTQLLDALGPDRDKAIIRLFSQGDPDDFSAFADLGAELHLDDDAFRSFHLMFASHVVILAKSTFSYLAGLLGGALCIYEPFRHPLLPGWLDFQSTESLPPDQLARAITTAVEHKPQAPA